jgi:enoyl-CoA hydratase
MTEEPEIIFETRGRAGVVTLNRPKALNALTHGMVGLMHGKLAEWAAMPDVELVVVKAAGGKAFCAGGDIRQLDAWGRAGDPAARAFYREEYRLNAFIKSYPKPYVALIDGIVMGGGVGVSVHGSHRVAGERTVFAMPETGIGLFPDVGGTFFLPRLSGNLGTWLALTGARLGRDACHRAGLATHAVAGRELDRILDRLCDEGRPDEVLARFVQPAGSDHDDPPLASIERLFGGGSVEAIIDALDAETGPDRDWARAQAATIRQKSPTSLRIAMRQMHDGARADFRECMRIEYRIVTRVLQGHDFYEGVRAVILDKDNSPQWQPPDLASVGEDDLARYFAPLPDELDLSDIADG